MNSTIEIAASTHLGKTSDGKTMKRYETPDKIDASLLVGIPRHLNRRELFDNMEPGFVGADVWNAYEFSTLDQEGFPLTGYVRFSYPSNSPNIVESKSMKLYLNSFNLSNEILPDRATSLPGFKNYRINKGAEIRIANDLEKVLGVKPSVSVSFTETHNVSSKEVFKNFIKLESIYDSDKKFFQFDQWSLPPSEHIYNFSSTTENPELLKMYPLSNSKTNGYSFKGLRSNCRVTNQPDWADVYIYTNGRNAVNPKSLIEYLVSFRNENHFHEEVCEMIYHRLDSIVRPDELMVACFYTRRGGIDINPIRCSSYAVFDKFKTVLADVEYPFKTMRQ